jgi:hypothetical protein
MLWLAALVTVAPLDRIHQIGLDHLVDAPSEDIVAIGTCRRPDATERDQVRTHVASWVAKSLPGQTLAIDPELRFGCDELTGTIVDVHVDTAGQHGQGYWWTLRVRPDRIQRIVEVTGESSQDWMEWSQEVDAQTLALADLDGDGRLDVVSDRSEHEGGSMEYANDLFGITARSGRRTALGHFDTDVTAMPGLPSLVVAIGDADDYKVFRCIGKDLTLGTCPDIALARMNVRATSAANRLAGADEIPDREELAADLAALGIFDPALLAAAPPTTREQHAERDIARWRAEQRGERTDAELDAAGAVEEAAYELALDVALGHTPCGPTTKAMLAVARAGHASGVATPACGPYVWVTWTYETTRVQQLVIVRGGRATPILRGEDPVDDDPTMEPAPMLTGAFHQGGAAILRDGRVDVVAGGEVVANQTGVDYAVLADTDRGPVITDGEHYFHAGTSGLEPVNDLALALIHHHQAVQEARDVETPTAEQLELLGAPAWLISEVQAIEADDDLGNE